MSVSELDNFYWSQNEPNRSCFLVLRDIILDIDENITTVYKYKLPFFLYKGKLFCYLWQNKKTKFPYIGIVKADLFEHPALIKGKRKKMKVLPINPNKDINVELVIEILKKAISQY